MSDPTPSPLPPAAPVPPAPPVPPAKKGMSTGCIIGLIVGIVGLVGLAVIAVVAAILVPLGKKTLEKARVLQTKAIMKGFELSVTGYQNEYNRLPELGTRDETTPVESTGPLVSILTGSDTGKNPRQIAFYEPPSPGRDGKSGGIIGADGRIEVRDLFGSLYRLHFDWNGDGVIPDPEHPGATISESVIIYSAGPDGDYRTWTDNVKSWGP